jgi:hypothetical protein
MVGSNPDNQSANAPHNQNANAPQQSSSGQPLPAPLLHLMEVRHCADFSDVRIHSGHNVAALGALAYTHGNHIYLQPDPYGILHPDPTIIAHELTHIMQQRAPGQLPTAKHTFKPVP